MDAIIGNAGSLGLVAAKAVLLYLVAVLGFRVTQRRTLAEMSGFDFVAAVAVGAVVGRVPNASGTSFLQGAVTLAVILAAHAAVARLRQHGDLGRLVDHAPRLLVSDGRVLAPALRSSGLTEADLFALLRQQGVLDLSEVRYVIFEQRGQVSVIRRPGTPGASGLLTSVLDAAAAAAPPGA